MSAIPVLAGAPNRFPDFVVLFERFQQIAVTAVTQRAMTGDISGICHAHRNNLKMKMTSDMPE
jgi:hypothetical protein